MIKFKIFPILYMQIIFLLLWILIFFFSKYIFHKKTKVLIAILFFLIASIGINIAVRYVKLSKNQKLPNNIPATLLPEQKQKA